MYVYRTRKPASLLGLALRSCPWWAWPPATFVACLASEIVNGAWWFGLALLLCTGRHFAYVGETVTFEGRHGEHMAGGGRWKRGAAAWSDLDAKCVLRLRLPRWKWLLRSVETLLIVLCCPAYNEKKNLWNPRRIPRWWAKRQRAKRDKRKVKWSFNVSAAHLVVIVAVLIVSKVGGVW